MSNILADEKNNQALLLRFVLEARHVVDEVRANPAENPSLNSFQALDLGIKILDAAIHGASIENTEHVSQASAHGDLAISRLMKRLMEGSVYQYREVWVRIRGTMVNIYGGNKVDDRLRKETVNFFSTLNEQAKQLLKTTLRLAA